MGTSKCIMCSAMTDCAVILSGLLASIVLLVENALFSLRKSKHSKSVRVMESNAFSFPCLCSEHRFSLPSAPKICYVEQKKRTRRNGRRRMDSLMLLVHSPLVGSFTWSLVAQQLQADGFDVLVPTLTDSGETPPPYWQQHAVSVQQALVSLPQERPLVLVGHSGAGSLLPVLAQAARHPVKAYLFVDADLPHPGKTQLEEMEASVPAFAQELRRLLAAGSRFPNWKDEDLRAVLPDGRA